MPPDARLGDPARLQALYAPEPHLDLVPRHILQQEAPLGWPARLRRLVGVGGGTVLVHVALATIFFYLLSFRDVETPREIEIPVSVVSEAPKPPGTPDGTKSAGPPEGTKGAGAPGGAGTGGTPGGVGRQASGPKADPTKPVAPNGTVAAPPPPPPKPPTQPDKAADALTPPSAPPPPPPAPKTPAQPAQPPGPPAAPPGVPAAPALVAPPPDAARSATQDKENKPANLVPDEHQTDQAIHEARPVTTPDVLTTLDTKAAASVPAPAKEPAPIDQPTPPIPAKTPSAADKLAAALPMDASAMPMAFRSVLAGNATAQINAAYAGVVQGRIRQAQAELARTAFAQHMSGNVAVAFTIDDAGKLVSLTVAQSSGNPQLDALAIRAIQSAAPFPPPPPEADHTFKKAFLVGG